MSTLYELKSEYQQLLQMIQDGEFDEQTLSDTMEAIGGEIEIKADGYAKIMKEIEGDSAKIKAEIDRLSGKKIVLDNSIKRLKESLESAMRETGKTKFKTDLFNFNIAKNGGKQPLEIFGEVPIEFYKTEIKPNNDLIREALESGKELPFAILRERGESLRIK